ncbi:MAG: helix-turn-helix domain-containing protein [Pseudomonadota bacterium]
MTDTKIKIKHIFAPVPARAVTDERLSALDLRVLIAIAGHDRFTANGLGCTASQKRLAQLTGCHSKSLPRTIARLQEFEYISVLPMGRSRRIKVIYAPADALIWNQKTDVKGNGTVTVHGELKSNDTIPIGNGVATVLDAIGNRPTEVLEQNQTVTNDNILGEALLNISGEAINKSREAKFGSQLSNSPLVRASNG